MIGRPKIIPIVTLHVCIYILATMPYVMLFCTFILFRSSIGVGSTVNPSSLYNVLNATGVNQLTFPLTGALLPATVSCE
jgi:hypothetical protein